MAKDALDAILDGDDNDLDDDFNIVDKDDDGEVLPTADDVKELEKRLADKDKELHGLLSTVKSERSKRQQAATELAELRGKVDGILSQRKTLQQELNAGANEDALRAAVQYTDDGDGYIKLDTAVKPLYDELKNEIKELKQALYTSQQQTVASQRGDELISAIVGEKSEWQPAYNKYKTAHKWLNDRVVEWQKDNNIQGELTGGQALDYVFTDTSEFEERFPGVDIATVLLAEDSQFTLRRMLDHIAEGSTPESKKPDSRFQKVLRKPSTLVRDANAKTEVSVVDKAGSLSAMDIMGLSDEAAAQLEKAMLREEKAEGIKWQN